MNAIEKWTDVIGYEGLYEISTFGKVRNKRTEKMLRFGSSGNYLSVMLYKNGQRERIAIHRMVAIAFIPNPQKLPCVNHKDENAHNNCVENLEWCMYKYNSNYGTAIKRRVEHTDWKSETLIASMIKNATHAKKPVLQTKNGNIINRFESIMEASRTTGIKHSSISKNLTGKSKTSGGYIWKYAN